MTSPAEPEASAALPLPANALCHSRIEIGRILQGLASANGSVSAEIGNNKLFMARVLGVTQASGHFFVAYCGNKALNTMLFALRSLEFTANYRNAYLAFRVTVPVGMLFEGQPAIRFTLPSALLLYRQRPRPNVPVPPEVSLRCVADEASVLPFETRIIDVSLDGRAGMLYAEDINIEVGSILRSNRIIIPAGKAIIADLEVLSTARVTLADGTLANHAELRFLQPVAEIKPLVDMFIQNLDAPALRLR